MIAVRQAVWHLKEVGLVVEVVLEPEADLGVASDLGQHPVASPEVRSAPRDWPIPVGDEPHACHPQLVRPLAGWPRSLVQHVPPDDSLARETRFPQRVARSVSVGGVQPDGLLR